MNKGEELMLFYTGITRKSESILSKMKLNKKILDKNKELVVRAMEGESIGSLLDAYWSLKRVLNHNVSNKLIDTYYQTALNLGSLGGKIVGAGGGGFLLLSVPPRIQEEFRKKFPLQELPFRVSQYGSRVIFNIS